MREILSRGKRTYNDKWVEGFYVCLHDQKGNASHRIYNGYAESDCGDLYPDWCEVNPNTVGQYTGLTDKNGKKIFEGDIVRTNNSNCEIWTVGYIRGAFSAEQTNANYKCALGIFMMTSQVEVIGNIHDNLDLVR